jgi:choline-sulfatase
MLNAARCAAPATFTRMTLRILFLLTTCVLGTLRPLDAAPASRPNILFLFADDFSFEAIRAFGHTDIDTPNLDRLAARGTAFTHAYNMGSWSPAVCIASRTMLITGRSVWNAQSVYAATDAERVAGRLWPQLLAASGYRTYFTGKWHIRADAEAAFDVARHIRPGMPTDVPEGYNRPAPGVPDPWSPSDPKFGGFWAGGKHWSEVGADDAIDFLREAKGAANPFFMYVAFNAPHDPRQAPAEYVRRYPLKRVAVPKNFLPEYPHMEAMGAGRDLRDEKLGPFPRTENAVKVHRQEYYALITHLDAQIGRVLAALEVTGQAQNTWIFFTADHGLAVGRHGLFGKQNMYEHSLRVPFLVVGPGVAAGRRISAPIYLQDVMPTTLALAGATPPAHVFFQNLLPLLRSETTASKYQAVYGAYLELQRAVIQNGWKLVLYPKAGVVRLYHLSVDPDESNDLANRPEHAGERQRLFAELLRLQAQLGDPLDLRGVYPKI